MALDLRGLEHKPISLAKREIRLLEIQPAQDIQDPISSRLVYCKITPELEYIGLCALLRDEENPGSEKITINGSKVTVPRTIGQALRHIRGLCLAQRAAQTQTQTQAGGGGGSGNDSLSTTSSGDDNGPLSPRLQANRPPRIKKPPPAWLQNLARGFRSILPDEASSSRNSRDGPLRVWLDCICIDGRNTVETEARRAHVAMAYENARLTIGWLGMKDPTSDLAISTVRDFEQVFPPNFGDPQDKIDHPENYSPIMRFLTPLAPLWEVDAQVNGCPQRGPVFVAIKNFISRPFFTRQWILEELTLSRFPAFLMGDEIVSWRQLLVWNRAEVEFEKAGSEGFSKEAFETIRSLPKMEYGVIFTLLDAFERRNAHPAPRVPW